LQNGGNDRLCRAGTNSAFVLCRKFAEAVGAAFVLRLQNAETGNDG